MKPGRALERLIGTLEAALAVNDNASIESPKRIPDKITGKLREHDVVLTFRQSHHTQTVAIECRDRSRKTTVAQVEAFRQKCLDTGINQGVIVATKGFCQSAKTKAAHYGIECISMDQAVAFPWLALDHVTVTERKIPHIHWHVYPEPPFDLTNDFATTYDFLDQNSDKRDLHHQLTPAVWKILEKILDESSTQPPSPLSLRFNAKGFSVRHRATGETIPLSHLVADVTFEINTQTVPVKLVSYARENSEENEIQAAVADLDVGNIKGSIVFTMRQQVGGGIVFVTEKEQRGKS